MNALYGGTSTSKLFLNVREKLSLCYYASSTYVRSKGILTVSSGIETADYDRAEAEILRQLDEIRQGLWEDWELTAARESLLSALQALGDSQGALENYYLGQSATGRRETPEEMAALLRQVTPGAHPGGSPECAAGYHLLPEGKGGVRMYYPRIDETVTFRRLKNGLPAYVVHKPGYTRKYAMFATRYGGMDLRFQQDGAWQDTPAGIAHYLEHKMFDTADGNAMQEMAKNGAEPNAFTSNAMTAYYFDCTEHFDENLRQLLSFVSVPYFTDESVAKEQGIIAQEIGMIEDDPEWQVYKRMLQALYRESPARIPVAGSVESISHITAETLYRCHKAFYTPANMCLVAVGDLDAEAVFRAAEDILPPESGPDIPRDYGGSEGETPAQSETSCRMEVSMPSFLVGFKCPAPPEGEQRLRWDILGDLACDILMGDSSPLFSRLYSQGLINGSFGSSFDLLPGAAYAYAGGDSKDANAVTDAILREAARIAAEGVDEDYFRRIRKASFGANLRGLNSFENIAVTLTEGYFHGYDPLRFPEVFESITPEDVAAFLKTNVTAERMVLSRIVPKQ